MNYSACVHGNEGTCRPVQQCGSLMFLKMTAMELWHREIRYIRLWKHIQHDTFIVGLDLLMRSMVNKKYQILSALSFYKTST